ncbi:MAG: TonB-dependent receptor [Verrucomicrobiota bacterium]
MRPQIATLAKQRRTHLAPVALLSGACITFFCVEETAFAQAQQAVENAVRQGESLRQQAEQRQKIQQQAEATPSDEPPETYPGENADLGPQAILKGKPKRKPFLEFSADTMFTWTSNATSIAGNPQDAGILAETLSLAIAPEPVDFWIGKLNWRAGYRHLFWVYDAWRMTPNLNGNNFEMSSAFSSANFSFLENWNASLGLDYNRIMNDAGVQGEPKQWKVGRLTDSSKWTEIYTEWNPTWSISRNIPLGDKTGLALGYNGGYHFTNTDQENGPRTWSSDHLDSGVSATLSFSPIEKWVLQPGIRFTHQVYTQPQGAGGHRIDRTLSPGLTVLWMPTARWSVRASLSSEFKHSNNMDTPNYSKVDAGGGLTFTFKF